MKAAVVARIFSGEETVSDIHRETRINNNILYRWKNNANDYIDECITCVHPEPANKRTKEERKRILETVNSVEFSSEIPCEIVPILAYHREYIESAFYKILKVEGMLAHRGRARKPQKRPISTYKATALYQLWM